MVWWVLGWLWRRKKEPDAPRRRPFTAAESEEWKRRWRMYELEEKLNPDYRYSRKVEEDLNDDGYFEKKENPTPEEIEENKKLWEELKNNNLVRFLVRSDEIAERKLAAELEKNSLPYRREDQKLWKALPHVPGPYNSRPIPRKSIRSVQEANDKFWDFFKQYLFGLWGYRQRPYPPERPIDVAQAVGYNLLEKRYYDFAMRSGGWYYKDRLGRTRGPMELVNLKTAWAAGIVDKNTFIWGDDMDEWAPIGMVYGLEAAINSIDVRLATAGTAFIQKLAKGLPPWRPNKGHEKKSYKQLQDEAIESKEREKAVMRQHGGVWPGQRIPSHALFLWASGSELTPLIEADNMPNKYIPYALRKRLVEIIPGLRPWEIISIEQTMDRITYNGKWYREPLGTYTRGPDYAKDWSEDVKEKYDMARDLFANVYNKLKDKLPLEEIRQEQREKKLQKMLKKSTHGREGK